MVFSRFFGSSGFLFIQLTDAVALGEQAERSLAGRGNLVGVPSCRGSPQIIDRQKKLPLQGLGGLTGDRVRIAELLGKPANAIRAGLALNLAEQGPGRGLQIPHVLHVRPAGAVLSDDFVSGHAGGDHAKAAKRQDDDEEQPQQSYESTPGTESVSVTKPATKTEPRVIFLDDSITRQNPDTVVRVRIKR